jgi:GTP cyclohydrolase II/RimJ/RimL family protein N-acetyltransferase
MTTARSRADRRCTDFAEKHGLKQVSVADLIAYRQRKETLINLRRPSTSTPPMARPRRMPIPLPWDPMQHLAVVFGDIRDGVDIPVRLHLENVAADVFGRDCHRLDPIMKRMGEQGRGVIVYLREGSVGVGVITTARAGKHEREEHSEAQARESEWLEIGLGAQILKDLGITSIRLLILARTPLCRPRRFWHRDRGDRDHLRGRRLYDRGDGGVLKMAVLQTTRLTLTPCTPSDCADFIDLELDPEVMRFLNGGHAVDRETIGPDATFLTPRGTEPYIWTARRTANGAFVGWFCLWPESEDLAELGYRLRRMDWGQGLASEGALALVNWGFRKRLSMTRSWQPRWR